MGVNCGGGMRKNRNMEVIKRGCEKRGGGGKGIKFD